MTTNKNKFKKEIEASKYSMSKEAKILFDLVDIRGYYKDEENAVRQTNRSEAGNFVNLLNQEIDELTNAMKKENKRYLNCKYLDAGMDGILCSKSLCTTCKEFNGEKCKDYISKDNPSKEEKQCEYCKDLTLTELPIRSNCDLLMERFQTLIANDGEGSKEIVISHEGKAFGIQLNYCPICGRKLK